MEALLGSTNWLYILLIGFVVGVLARFLKPGRDSMGILMTILLGIAGAMLASWFGQAMGWYAPGQAAGSSEHAGRDAIWWWSPVAAGAGACARTRHYQGPSTRRSPARRVRPACGDRVGTSSGDSAARRASRCR